MNRPEETIIFYRQAVDLYIETGDKRYEGVARSNTANTLLKLNRYTEARAEIQRAIECKSQVGLAAEPWTSFEILRQIETATGNHAAAQTAWTQARDAYLAYRRQGGYAQTPGGELADQIIELIRTGQVDEAHKHLEQITSDGDLPDWYQSIAEKFFMIIKGTRDLSIAEDMSIGYSNAADVLFLMERLG